MKGLPAKAEHYIQELTAFPFFYDPLNSLKKLYSDGVLTASYTYDVNGNRDTLTYNQAGITTDYDYNLTNKLTILTNSRGATQLSKYEYTYFYDGNQAGKRETAPSGVKNTSYVYDGLGRLKQESMGGQITAYTYDDFGNRSTMAVTGIPAPYNVAYRYDHNNRLLTETKTQGEVDEITRYGYDNNGNQIYKAKEILQPINPSEQESISAYVLGESEDSGVTLSTYDGFNQLIQVIEGTNTIRYTYNADGHRSSKTVNGTTTKHIWDGSQIALELNAAGAVTNKYIRGINLVAADNTAGARSYYVYNGHGDTVQLTGASGNVIKSYEYDAFGNELNIDNSDTNVFRYAGEYFDKETGTIYLRARYYDPEIGRFITEDTNRGKDSDPLSLNLYTYCGNNPVNLIDPSGHKFYIIGDEEGPYYDENGNINFCILTKQQLEALPYAIPDGPVAVGMFTTAKKVPGLIEKGWGLLKGLFRTERVSVWSMSTFERGWAIEKMLGGMGNNFPIIDKFVNGTKGFASSITSIKSLDLAAKTYQKGNSVYSTIMKYTDDLAGFTSTTWNKITVNVNSSTNRILELAIPRNASAGQLKQINQAVTDAAKNGIDVVIKYFD